MTINKDEVLVEFKVTGSDGRHVTFQGPAPIAGIRDWFERAALGVSYVFEPLGPTSLRCVNGGPNKINSIKKTREITNIGLREAKDFVEGTQNLRIDPILSKQLIAELRVLQCTVVGTSGTNRDIIVGSAEPVSGVSGAPSGLSVNVNVNIGQTIADKVREALIGPY